jgi:hypothetical protein
MAPVVQLVCIGLQKHQLRRGVVKDQGWRGGGEASACSSRASPTFTPLLTKSTSPRFTTPSNVLRGGCPVHHTLSELARDANQGPELSLLSRLV